MPKKLQRDNDGTLPIFAWPGGYPIAYLMADGECLCPDCANGKNGSEAAETSDDKQWQIIGTVIHWEGEPVTCAHCNAEIESAYGVPDEESL